MQGKGWLYDVWSMGCSGCLHWEIRWSPLLEMPRAHDRKIGELTLRLKPTLRYILPLFGSTLVLVILFHQIEVHKIGAAIQHLNALRLVLVTLLSVPFVLLKAFKWHTLLRLLIPEVSYRLGLCSFLLGLTASLFTPGRFGELARVVYFPGNRTALLPLALVDKLVDMSVLLTLCALSLWAYSIALGIAGMVGTLLLAISVWIGLRLGLKFIDGLLRLRTAVSVHILAHNAVLAVGCYALMALQFHLLLSDLHPVSLWASSSAMPPILLLSAMPVFINGLGGREGLAILLLGHYDVPEAPALLAAFLLFVVNGLLPGALGVVPGLTTLLRQRETVN